MVVDKLTIRSSRDVQRNPGDVNDIVEDLPPLTIKEVSKPPEKAEQPDEEMKETPAKVEAPRDNEVSENTTPKPESPPKKSYLGKRVTRSEQQKKSTVSAHSKTINKQSPLQYMTKMCYKYPKAMHKLCRLRELTKNVRLSVPGTKFEMY